MEKQGYVDIHKHESTDKWMKRINKIIGEI